MPQQFCKILGKNENIKDYFLFVLSKKKKKKQSFIKSFKRRENQKDLNIKRLRTASLPSDSGFLYFGFSEEIYNTGKSLLLSRSRRFSRTLESRNLLPNRHFPQLSAPSHL